jgi:hypothetical protein
MVGPEEVRGKPAVATPRVAQAVAVLAGGAPVAALVEGPQLAVAQQVDFETLTWWSRVSTLTVV